MRERRRGEVRAKLTFKEEAVEDGNDGTGPVLVLSDDTDGGTCNNTKVNLPDEQYDQQHITKRAATFEGDAFELVDEVCGCR